MSKEPTLVDKKFDRLRNNRFVASVIVCALVIIALASFIDATIKISAFVPKLAKLIPSSPMQSGEWVYAVVPQSGAYKGHVQGTVTTFAPRRHEIIPEKIELSAGWESCPGAFGWGSWNGSATLSADRTMAMATYDNFKDNCAVKIGIRAPYRRVWTSEDSLLVSILCLALAFIIYVLFHFKSQRRLQTPPVA